MKKTISFLLCAALLYGCGESSTTTTADNERATTDTTDGNIASSRRYEFGEDKYIDLARKGQQDLASGNIDSWLANFDDNAIYRFSGGDSLNGKQAISDYWKKRRSEVIDSLSYTNEVWLPVKVNTPMAATQLPGNYALTWNMVHAKYKSGKSMHQRMHIVFHFNDNDKIDRITQYLDRVPVREAEK